MKDCLGKLNKLMPGRAVGSVRELIDTTFLAYNSARLRETCHVFTEKYSEENVVIGVSVAGALTPAGLGVSCIVPLMEMGLIDWIVATGANLYHDLHFALGQELFKGKHNYDDCDLKENGIVRIYDILFKDSVLFESDKYCREFCRDLNRSGSISTAEFHYLLGKKLLEDFEDRKSLSVLMTAAELDIPIFTSSPGDSTLGMNLAAVTLEKRDLSFNVNVDVNQTAAIVYNTKKNDKKSGLLILGGGAPKNFCLQTEPYIQEILGLKESGHDYFIQFTDARPDTGGLSGATPSEAVSWGKITPEMLPDSVVCYGDTSVYLPLLTSYVTEAGIKKRYKRLYSRLVEMFSEMREDYLSNK
jgi:deoxyhypusine synthase